MQLKQLKITEWIEEPATTHYNRIYEEWKPCGKLGFFQAEKNKLKEREG